MLERKLFAPLCTSSFIFLSILLTPTKIFARPIRSIEVDDGGVALVKTAVGYSTILEFQSKPISAVLGDQDSFKLEYVSNSITIKPLVPHAKSNLFIFTEFERFNCQIETVSPGQVDYIVRIHPKVKSYPVQTIGSGEASGNDRPMLIARKIGRSSIFDGFTLTVISTSHEKDLTNPRAVTLIDFSVSSKTKPYTFYPRSIGIKQFGQFLNLESIYLDSISLVPRAPAIHGKLAILSQDFNPRFPVTLVFAVPSVRSAHGVRLIEVSTAVPVQRNKPILQIFPTDKKTAEKGK